MVSYAATRYKLGLGAQDSITGQRRELWTAEAILLTIYPSGSGGFMMYSAGRHYSSDAIGLTEYVVREDDVLLQNDLHWRIVGEPRRWTVGNTPKFLVVPLKRAPNFPVPMTEPVPPPGSSHFFGFEQIIVGVQEFEDGFERGWM